MAFAAGDFLTAALLNNTFPTSMDDIQNTAGTTTSAAYVETLTSGTACSGVFTAPLSGKVIVVSSAQIDNSGAQTSLMSFVIRTGSSIGSGTTFLAASDDDALRNIGTDETQDTYVRLVTGLTAGAIYNIRQAFRGSGGTTATFSRKRLSVIPVPA